MARFFDADSGINNNNNNNNSNNNNNNNNSIVNRKTDRGTLVREAESIQAVEWNAPDTFVINNPLALEQGGPASINGITRRNAAQLISVLQPIAQSSSLPMNRQDSQRIPGSANLTQGQARNAIALLLRGYRSLATSPRIDAAYAVPNDAPTEPLDHRVAQVALTDGIVGTMVAEDRAEYVVRLFQTYAADLASQIGWNKKPAVNFSVARHLNRIIPRAKTTATLQGILPEPVMGGDLEAISYMRERGPAGAPSPGNAIAESVRLSRESGVPLWKSVSVVIPWSAGLNRKLTDEAAIALSHMDPVEVSRIVKRLRKGGDPSLYGLLSDTYTAAWLVDSDFEKRLRSVEPESLLRAAREIPIDGPRVLSKPSLSLSPLLVSYSDRIRYIPSSVPSPVTPMMSSTFPSTQPSEYVIYEEDLFMGRPVAPPVKRSYGPRIMSQGYTPFQGIIQ